MPRTARLFLVSTAVAAIGLVGAPGALAQSTSEYSGTDDTAVLDDALESTPDAAGTSGSAGTAGGQSEVSARVGSGPSTLPFTGGEVVLVAAAGAAAVAAGAALVAGGRRRSRT